MHFVHLKTSGFLRMLRNRNRIVRSNTWFIHSLLGPPPPRLSPGVVNLERPAADLHPIEEHHDRPLTVADGRLRARLGTAANNTHSAPAVTGARIDDGKLNND